MMDTYTEKDFMPFGKYRKDGPTPKTLGNVPTSYLKWLYGRLHLSAHPLSHTQHVLKRYLESRGHHE